jgi:L-alanine-DL-glutamate epimerase-like enolase superfamily enzyme
MIIFAAVSARDAFDHCSGVLVLPATSAPGKPMRPPAMSDRGGPLAFTAGAHKVVPGGLAIEGLRMLITDVRAHHIRIPYDAGPASFRQGASAIAALDIVLVEVSTDAGITGWGDAFCYVCPRSTATAVAEMMAPQARGQEAPDAAGIPAFMEQIQRNLHLFGRYGITMFAISGLDIALWDLAARAQNKPLHKLLGAQKRASVPAYASLLRIGDPALVAGECDAAMKRGYPAVKLHETTVPAVAAARQAIGAGVPLMVDMNCPMDGAAAIQFAHACRAAAPRFLEEPVWPPEDFATLAKVRAEGGMDIAAGENACTEHQFRQMLKAGAVSHAQPSVTKVGGITEYLKVAALADAMGVALAPHSPYFGPGLLATLHLMSVRDDGAFVEMFYLNRAACLWRGRIDPDAKGAVAVPDGPGLGYEPDTAVMERYRVS